MYCGHVFMYLSQPQPPQGKPPKSPAPSKPSHPHHSHTSLTVRKTHSPRIREPVRTRGIYIQVHSGSSMFPFHSPHVSNLPCFQSSKFHTPFGHVSKRLFPILPFPCFRSSVFPFSKLPFPMFLFPFTHVPIPTFPFFHSHVLNPLCFQTPIHPCSESLSPMFPYPIPHVSKPPFPRVPRHPFPRVDGLHSLQCVLQSSVPCSR